MKLNIEPFRRWLEKTDQPAIPCDGGKCVLAMWLHDVGYADVDVDGETVYLGDDDGHVETPEWCNHVMSAFDAMGGNPADARVSSAPIAPEVYKEPLLGLVNRLIANDKLFADRTP